MLVRFFFSDMRDLILRKMTGGDIDDPVSPGILVELDAVSPTSQPPLPELNVAAYFLVRCLLDLRSYGSVPETPMNSCTDSMLTSVHM